MPDDEYRLYKLRRFAGGILRGQSMSHYAEKVERGELVDCQEMRIAAFFVDPPQPHDAEFIAAWNESAAIVNTRTPAF